jgi:hypothetical protein
MDGEENEKNVEEAIIEVGSLSGKTEPWGQAPFSTLKH